MRLIALLKVNIGKILGGVCSILIASSFALAGGINGMVNGPDGAPFKGAFVEAQNLKTKITFIVLSDPQGRYHIENLPAGEYDVSVQGGGL